MMSLSTQTFPSSSSSSSSCPSFSSRTTWAYDVFLSFCGEDTRMGFIDHLHAALKRKGCIVFKDDKKLQQGKEISQELLTAIQESKYAIVVISKNYAFSSWCLRELTQIIECMKEGCLIVLPIFYHVNPSDVRKQKGSFGEAFNKHRNNLRIQKRHMMSWGATLKEVVDCVVWFVKSLPPNANLPNFDEDPMKSWRIALKEVGNISGWHVYDRPESEVIEEISEMISCGLIRDLPYYSKDFVGMEQRVYEVKKLLRIRQDDVRIIGICGMGGIGKSTLAKIIYDRVSTKFQASCFIESIKEESSNQRLVHLQKQLIAKMLKEKDIDILNTFDGVKLLKKRLQNIKSFIVLDDVDENEQLENLVGRHDWFGHGSRIIVTCRDSHLLARYVDDIYKVTELNDAEALKLFCLKAFKRHHPKYNYIKLSKDVVHYSQGLPLALEVFGSFLFDRSVDEWTSALAQLKTNPQGEIFVKLKISFDGLENLQKQLFLDIACFFNGWCEDRIFSMWESCGYYPKINLQVLREKSLLKSSKSGELRMHDLLVKLGQKIVHDESPKEPGQRSRLWYYEDIIHVLKNNTGTDAIESIILKLSSPEQLSFDAFSKMKKLKILMITNQTYWFDKHDIVEWYGNCSEFILSNELRVMKWHKYPLESLPHSFQPDNLFELEMPFSCIKQLWNGWKGFYRLQRINLRGSQDLIETPNFNGVPNLEILDLSLCENLSKVHPSIEILKKLREFSLEGCHCLDKISLESLPSWLSSLNSLEKLDLSSCELWDGTIPSDLTFLPSLKSLTLGSNKFTRIPGSIWLLPRLEELDLSGSPQLEALPKLPLSTLRSLRSLYLNGCNLHDGAIPDDFGCSSSLMNLFLGGNKFTKIPYGIWQLPNLRRLDLENCSWLEDLNSLPLSSLRFLEDLNLGNCNLRDGAILDALGCLSSLVSLALGGNELTNVPDSVCQLSSLLDLHLNDLSSLRTLPKLPMSLAHLDISNCPMLKRYYTEMGVWDSWYNIDCSIAIAYIGYNDQPYKTLYLHPLGCLRRHEYQFLSVVACGRMLDSTTIFSPVVDTVMQRGSFLSRRDPYLVDTSYMAGCMGCALFIDYEILEHQNAEHAGSHSASHIFVCIFEINGESLRKPLVLSVPKVPSNTGRNGFWVFIPVEWFRKQRNLDDVDQPLASELTSVQNVEIKYIPAQSFKDRAGLENYDRIQASIATSSQDVEVKECRNWVVPSMRRLSAVLSAISGMDYAGLEECFRDLKSLGVDSPFPWTNQ